MTGHTDWREARLAATHSPAFMAGRRAYSVMGRADQVCPYADWVNRQDFLRGWESADQEHDEARDRAREDRQHYPLSPMSAFERNRP